MTPYERLKSLPGATESLKPGVSFAQLDELAHAMSDNQAAKQLNQARNKLFRDIEKTQTPAA